MKAPQLIGSVTVGERGQIVVPAEARNRINIKFGDKLLVFSAPIDDVLIIAKPDAFEDLVKQIGLTRDNARKVSKNDK